jgi:hypothetical protein
MSITSPPSGSQVDRTNIVRQPHIWKELKESNARVFFVYLSGAILIFIPVAVIVGIIAYLIIGKDVFGDRLDMDVVHKHWAGIFVFPGLVYFALFLVLITKIVSGDIHFKFGSTFEISGAASEGLMWILVFVSLTWGFSELWKLSMG